MIFFKKKPKPNKNNLDNGLLKTRQLLFDGLKEIFVTKNSNEIIKTLENRLLTADVGLETTSMIINNIKQNVKKTTNESEWFAAIKDELLLLLNPVAIPLDVNGKHPFVILVVGVNGAGKTTTIGKMAKKFTDQGKTVMLAAGDTFRAAAVEQLQSWANKYNIKVTAQHTGADSASVIYDAIDSAKAKNIDVVIADTAGRLHTQDNLMSELAKIKRVIQKHGTNYPHETLLVLDAGIGQNAVQQVTKFDKLLNLSGLVLTKMDGTAKGGILLALAHKNKLPVRYIGIGEQADDLLSLTADDFVNALLK